MVVGERKLIGFFKDSMLYGVGDALGRMVGLLMLPILTRIFVPADYGSIDLLAVAYTFLLAGSTFNVITGMQKKYYEYEGNERKKMLTSASFFLVLVAGVISIFLIVSATHLSTLIEGTDRLSGPIQIMAICLPIDMFGSCLVLLLRLQRKAVLYSVVSIAKVIITPLATIVFVVFYAFGISGVFFGRLAASIIITGVLFFIVRANFSRSFSWHHLSVLLKYSLPGHPGILAGQAMHLLPRYLLAAFSTLTAVGIFSVAFRLSNIINMFNNAFNMAWNPFAFANAGTDDEEHLYGIIFTVYGFALILLTTVVSLFARELLIILTPAEYHSASLLVAGIAYYFALRGLCIIFSTALYTQHQVSKVSFLNLMQVAVFLCCALFLIPKYGAAGLIAAMDLSISVYFFTYMKVTFHYFSFPVPGKQFLLISFASICCIMLFNQQVLPMLPAIFFKGIVLVMLFVFGYLVLFSSEQRRTILIYLRQLRKTTA